MLYLLENPTIGLDFSTSCLSLVKLGTTPGSRPWWKSTIISRSLRQSTAQVLHIRVQPCLFHRRPHRNFYIRGRLKIENSKAIFTLFMWLLALVVLDGVNCIVSHQWTLVLIRGHCHDKYSRSFLTTHAWKKTWMLMESESLRALEFPLIKKTPKELAVSSWLFSRFLLRN